jgi:hypothetical protein
MFKGKNVHFIICRALRNNDCKESNASTELRNNSQTLNFENIPIIEMNVIEPLPPPASLRYKAPSPP